MQKFSCCFPVSLLARIQIDIAELAVFHKNLHRRPQRTRRRIRNWFSSRSRVPFPTVRIVFSTSVILCDLCDLLFKSFLVFPCFTNLPGFKSTSLSSPSYTRICTEGHNCMIRWHRFRRLISAAFCSVFYTADKFVF